jgi:hypothetical protein
MGRRKIEPENKKQTVSIRIPLELLSSIEDVKNKSKFFECLLVEYFNTLNNK